MIKSLLALGLLVSLNQFNAKEASLPSDTSLVSMLQSEKTGGPVDSKSTLERLSRFTGISLDPLPSSGCSGSALPPGKVQDLLRDLDEPTRSTLSSAFKSSSAVWAIQLYVGTDGSGFCFPEQGKLLRVSGLKMVDSPSNPKLSERIGDLIKSIGKAIPKWFAPS